MECIYLTQSDLLGKNDNIDLKVFARINQSVLRYTIYILVVVVVVVIVPFILIKRTDVVSGEGIIDSF